MGDDTPAMLAEGETRVAEMDTGCSFRETDVDDKSPTAAAAAAAATAATEATTVAIAAPTSAEEIPAGGELPAGNGDGAVADSTAGMVVDKALADGLQPKAAAVEAALDIAPSSEPPSAPQEAAEPVAATRKRKAGQEAPSSSPPLEVTTPKATGLAVGVRIEDLAQAVRKRMNEVLQEGEDDEMRRDARLVNFLGEVEEAQALAALNEYHAAVSEASVTIRNKPAYLMGILRKYKQGQRAPLGNGTSGGMATAPKAMGRMGAGPDGLSPSIASRLEKLYESGFIQKSDVDQRCLVFFRDLTEKEAEAAMDEFGQSDITSIRNKSAFLMSILKRHHQASNPPAGAAAAASAAAAGAGAGAAGRPTPAAAAAAAMAAAAAAAAGMGMGMGVYGGHPFAGAPHMAPYGYMDPLSMAMAGPASLADFYGAGYGHMPQMFNAYGQPMGTFIPPHVPMYQPGSSGMLPASVQLRLDQLAGMGFCHPGEIDDRCRKFLGEVPEHIALQAIDEFMSTDRKHIRKVSAYFMGVIRKHAENFREFAAMGKSGGPPPGPPGPREAGMKRIREYSDFCAKNQSRPQGGSALMERMAGAPAKVKAGIYELVEKGIAVEWDIDVRVTNAFSGLTEEQGVEAIEEFASCDMTRIRNKSAYLMGLLKRYKTGSAPHPGLAQR